MNKTITNVIIFTLFLVISISFLWKVKLPVSAQTLQISMYVYGGLRDASMPENNLSFAGNNIQPKNTFDISSNTTVKAHTDYRIRINGLNPSSQTFKINQQRIDPSPSAVIANSYYTPAAQTQINGTFNIPAYDYELWKIWAEQEANQSRQIYFYLVKEDIPSNPQNKPDQYKIEFNPESVVSLESGNVASNLAVSWNKIYCIDQVQSGSLSVSSNKTSQQAGIAGFPSAVSKSNFSSYAASINFPLSITKHTEQTIYTAQLIGSILSNLAQLTVYPTGATPPIESQYQCYSGFCFNCPSDKVPPSSDCKVVNPTNCQTAENPEGCETITSSQYQCYYGFCFDCPSDKSPPSPICKVVNPQNCKTTENPDGCKIKIRE